MNEEMISETVALLQNVRADPNIKAAVFISGKSGNFIAGADLKMLQKCKTQEEVTGISRVAQETLQDIESFPKPIIAAVSGSCLGGGFEVCNS